MSFWKLLLSGLRRRPKEHMPWLGELAQEQRQVKRATREARQRMEELAALRAERGAMYRLRQRRLQEGDGGC